MDKIHELSRSAPTLGTSDGHHPDMAHPVTEAGVINGPNGDFGTDAFEGDLGRSGDLTTPSAPESQTCTATCQDTVQCSPLRSRALLGADTCKESTETPLEAEVPRCDGETSGAIEIGEAEKPYERMITGRVLADIIGLDERTVERRAARGDIPSLKLTHNVRRFYLSEVETSMRQRAREEAEARRLANMDKAAVTAKKAATEEDAAPTKARPIKAKRVVRAKAAKSTSSPETEAESKGANASPQRDTRAVLSTESPPKNHEKLRSSSPASNAELTLEF